jgi:D-3-phosphoglycerate dehydrogenase
MKDGVVVVNTARGAVIDEAALVDALDSGKVYSAGLDVFEEEPKVHPGLTRNPNVLLVPHMGTWTVEVCFLFLSFFLFQPRDELMTTRHKPQWKNGRLPMFARLLSKVP